MSVKILLKQTRNVYLDNNSSSKTRPQEKAQTMIPCFPPACSFVRALFAFIMYVNKGKFKMSCKH